MFTKEDVKALEQAIEKKIANWSDAEIEDRMEEVRQIIFRETKKANALLKRSLRTGESWAWLEGERQTYALLPLKVELRVLDEAKREA